MFHPYPSVSNKADLVAQAAKAQPDVVWVATPKLHGCNVSVIVTPAAGTVTHCRRNGVLHPTDSFYNHQHVLAPDDVWQRLIPLFPTAASVTVFGELYGGGYAPCEGVVRNPSASLVQRGVLYGPDNYFVAFDVRVDDTFLDFYDACAVCTRIGVPTIPWRFRGVFEDVLAWATANASAPTWPLGQVPVGVRPARVQASGEAVFDPDTFGALPPIADNTGEGWVVRPVRELQLPYGDRAMLKVKSPRFAEVAEAPAVVIKAAKGGAVASQLAAGSEYLTPARAAAVASKLPQQDVSIKQLPYLATLLQEDALKDMPGDHPLRVDMDLHGPKCPAAKAFLAQCFATMKQHVVVLKQ